MLASIRLAGSWSRPGPPVTTIDSASAFGDSAVVAFHSDQAVTFRCELDSGAWLPCSSPVGYTGLANGKHTVSVQGSNSGGLSDYTPASASFSIAYTASGPAPQPSGPSPTRPKPLIDLRSFARGLEGEVAVALRRPAPRQLLQGLSLTLLTPVPGTVSVVVRGGTKDAVLARASRRFRGPGAALAPLHLTRAGRSLLRTGKRLRVTVTVTLAASGTPPVSAQGKARL